MKTVPYYITGVHFVMSPNTAALTRREPASVGTRLKRHTLQHSSKLQDKLWIDEALLNFYLPACNTTRILYIITWFQLIFTLKDTYKRRIIQNRELGRRGGGMNDINSMVVSYRRAIKRKMTEWHSSENKTVTIAPFYCNIRRGRGLDAIFCHH